MLGHRLRWEEVGRGSGAQDRRRVVAVEQQADRDTGWRLRPMTSDIVHRGVRRRS